MKKFLLVLAVGAVAVATSAGVASAGGWATVGLSSLPPAGLEAGTTWPVDITVLQHGETPLTGVTPIVRIRDGIGTVVESFTATPTDKAGVYHAEVEFPGAGSYSYEVYDGFGVYGGAQTHTFKPVEIAAPGGGSFPLFELGLGVALALALAAATILLLRRSRREPQPIGLGEAA